MSFGRKHPEAVQAAVGEAAIRGLKVPAITRALAAGTLPGYPEPYDLPIESTRYYAKTAINKAAASTITTRAAGDPSKAIDYLARQALSEAEIGLKEVRQGKQRDPEAVARWVNVLKVIAPLLRAEAQDDEKGKGKRKPPQDALTARLTAKPNNPSLPAAQDTQEEEGASRAAATEPNTETPDDTQHNDHHSAGFLHGSPSWAA